MVASLTEYAPFGTLTSGSLPESAVGFTGQRLDESTGLYFYNSRYYDPSLGRFIQADYLIPSFEDPQSLNRYAYARNNPVRFIDPTGHSWFSKLIGAILGTLAFILSGGNLAVGFAVFSFFDTAIAAYQAGASLGRAAALGAGTAAASAIGFQVGFGAGEVLGGSLGGLIGGFAGAGALSGLTGAAIGGGDLGHAAWVGAVAGVTTAVAGPVIGGGVGAELSGGSFGSGALEGAYGVAATLLMVATIQAVAEGAYDEPGVMANGSRAPPGDISEGRVGARPLEGAPGNFGVRHRFFAGADGRIVELGVEGGSIRIYDSTLEDGRLTRGTLHYLKNEPNKILWSDTTLYSNSLLDAAIVSYRSRWEGTPYRFYSHNSNYFVNTVVYGAGGNISGHLGISPGLPDR